MTENNNHLFSSRVCSLGRVCKGKSSAVCGMSSGCSKVGGDWHPGAGNIWRQLMPDVTWAGAVSCHAVCGPSTWLLGFFKAWLLFPRVRNPRQQGGSSCYFYDLDPKVTQHHFYRDRLVKAIPEVHLGSQRGNTQNILEISWFKYPFLEYLFFRHNVKCCEYQISRTRSQHWRSAQGHNWLVKSEGHCSL